MKQYKVTAHYILKKTGERTGVEYNGIINVSERQNALEYAKSCLFMAQFGNGTEAEFYEYLCSPVIQIEEVTQ